MFTSYEQQWPDDEKYSPITVIIGTSMPNNQAVLLFVKSISFFLNISCEDGLDGNGDHDRDYDDSDDDCENDNNNVPMPLLLLIIGKGLKRCCRF